jgi:hypothetical protein
MSVRWLIGGYSAHTSQRRHPHSLVSRVLCCGLRSDPALVERFYPDMGLSRAQRFARGVSLVAAVLICVGILLCLLPTALAFSTAPTLADSPSIDRGADQGYFAVPQEGVWEEDKDLMNADLLTMLLLAVSSFFGLGFGWVLTNSQRQGAIRALGVVGPSLASAYTDLPFLGVLRL